MNGKFAMTLVGLIIAALAIMTFTNEQTRENFWGNSGVPRTVKTMDVLKAGNGQMYGLQNNYKQKMLYNPENNSQFYQVPGTWQSQLSPRMSGGANFGANIRYNMPSQEHMGVPCEPLIFSTMAQENYSPDKREDYCGSCSSPAATCGSGGISPNVSSSAARATQMGSDPAYKSEMMGLQHQVTASELPMNDLTVMSPDGDVTNPVVFSRYIYANQKSRLWQQGDPIRGDLPVVPCTTGWFRPSVHPQIDLRSGALAVIGGQHNDNANDLWNLQNNASGGFDTTLAGVNMTAQSIGSVNQASGDVQFTAFP